MTDAPVPLSSCWTLSSKSVSVLRWGSQTWRQHSSYGFTSAEQRGSPPWTRPEYYNNTINGRLKLHCARADDGSPHSSDKCHTIIADAFPCKQQIYPVVLMKNTVSSSLLGLLAGVDYSEVWLKDQREMSVTNFYNQECSSLSGGSLSSFHQRIENFCQRTLDTATLKNWLSQKKIIKSFGMPQEYLYAALRSAVQKSQLWSQTLCSCFSTPMQPWALPSFSSGGTDQC